MSLFITSPLKAYKLAITFETKIMALLFAHNTIPPVLGPRRDVYAGLTR
jgi:hypothetical protein